jgi:alkylation response protein AidB-like acyl-CoA dehydrogenase
LYLFLVDTKTEGISATKLDKLGWRASDTAEIAFDNVEIPLENLMGEEGKVSLYYAAFCFRAFDYGY